MNSDDAVFLFEENPQLFDTYHDGFAEQGLIYYSGRI